MDTEPASEEVDIEPEGNGRDNEQVGEADKLLRRRLADELEQFRHRLRRLRPLLIVQVLDAAHEEDDRLPEREIWLRLIVLGRRRHWIQRSLLVHYRYVHLLLLGLHKVFADAATRVDGVAEASDVLTIVFIEATPEGDAVQLSAVNSHN